MKKPQYTLSRYMLCIFSWLVLGFVFLMYLFPNCPQTANSQPVPPVTQRETPDSMSVISLSMEQSTPKPQIQKPIHILLIGQDRREDEPRSRSDCMILCSFIPENGSLIMTSFLRDLYVQIPGFSGNRLNAAYAFGGMPLIRQTFLDNFGIEVDGCVEVDFSQFSQLVDLLGGVCITLRQDEASHINAEVPGSTLAEGPELLNGVQALAYSRIRSLDEDGDFSRTNRQRNVLIALLNRCKDASVSEMLRLFREAAPMMSTDFRKSELLKLIRQLSPMLSSMKVTSQRIPQEGSYCHRIVDGMAVLVTDLEAARAFLQKSFSGS